MRSIIGPSAPSLPGRFIVVAAGGALLAVLVAWTVTRAPSGSICPDFIQLWTAARLLASGQSPYDPGLQAAIQQRLGWRTGVEGLGLYNFLPYYYPPWLGLLCIPLLPLGYRGAQIVWLTINTGLLLAAALVVRRSAQRVASFIPVVLVLAFAPCLLTLLMGQVSMLILLPVVVAWRLLDDGRDIGAGAVLAWLTIKPQLTVALIAGVLLWAARRGRWQVVASFFATLAALIMTAMLFVPRWPMQFLAATQVTRLPTDVFPWTGTTAFMVLKTIGMRGAALWLCSAAIAAPFVALVLRESLDRSSRLEYLVGLALIAPFFAGPYARHYDFVILLVPVLILVRLRPNASAPLVMTLLLLPYVHLMLFGRLAAWTGVAPFPGPQFTFFWMPLIVAAAWFATRLPLPLSAASTQVASELRG